MPRRSFALACHLFVLLSALLLPAAAFAGILRSVNVRWTAPGDDGAIGQAGLYDLRYSPLPITELTFKLAQRVPGPPRPAVAGTPQSTTVYDLSKRVGYYFAIRTADTNGNWSKISNVIYVPPDITGVGVFDAAAPVSFATPQPNPARSGTRLGYTLPTAMQVDVDVYDVAGRRVHGLAHGWKEPGVHDIAWDLRGENGIKLEPGLYLVHARLGDRTWSKRLTILD